MAGTKGRRPDVIRITHAPSAGWAPWAVALSVAVVAAAACEEQTPTAPGEKVPTAPSTVELELPWSAFGSNLEVFGGYGEPSELGVGFVAEDFGGSLTARTLVRFAPYPRTASVRDTTGTIRTDSSLAILGGRVVAVFDTLGSTNTGPVTLALGALQAEWDPLSASWEVAVDTLGDTRLWPEAGAGPVTPLTTAVWDPATGDSALFQLDSAQLAMWADTSDVTRGARLDVLTGGVRLELRRAAVQLDVRPSVNPDTTISLPVPTSRVTFVYDPLPDPPPDGIRVGGAPAWRTVLDVDLPVQLDGPPELCAVVSCPHVLEEGEISFAALVLTSRATEEPFQPSDTVGLDVRSVLKRAAMPKSPLGASLIGDFLGRRVAPEAFGSGAGERIEVPITDFVRALLAGDDGSGPPPNALALLSAVEPLSISFASFEGPGSPDEPVLRLVLTIGPAVELP